MAQREEVQNNLASLQSYNLGMLMLKTTSAYLEGNISVWFNHLSCMRELINYSLTKTERKELDKMEMEIYKLLPAYRRASQGEVLGHKVVTEDKKKSLLCKTYIRFYQRTLFDDMKKVGLFPSKKVSHFMG